MKIVEPSYELRTQSGSLTQESGIELLRWIEWNARISHSSEELQKEDSWKRFLENVLIKRGDWSIAEHVNVSAIIITDRGITHELVRHRHYSFTQESTRFVRYKDGLRFIRPIELPEESWQIWEMSCSDSERDYLLMLDRKVRPQEARSVLNNSVAAKISVTGNLRNWRSFLLARTTNESHPDIRRITIPMLTDFQRIFPILFDDIFPNVRQIENLSKAR